MTFRLLHTVTFATIPLLGVLALYTAAALPTWVAMTGLLGIAAGLLVPEDLRARVPAAVTGIIPLALAGGAAFAVARGAEPVLVAVSFSVALQLIRVATRQGATHDPQIVVLAILHIVSAAVLGGTIAFGACLAAFVVIAPAALTLSHLRREVERNYEAGAKDRAGRRVDVERILKSRRVAEPKWVARSLVIAPFVFAFTAVLFLVVPRVGLAVFLLKPPAGTRMIGFSDAVDLGTMGELQANDALAARVEWEPPGGERAPQLLPFYLRGTAFDAYDGRGWKKTDASAGAPLDITRAPADVNLAPRPATSSLLTVRLEPLEPTVLFIPSGARALHFEPTADGADEVLVHAGPEDEWRYEAKQPIAIRYQARVTADRANPMTTLPPHEAERYLQLPKGLDPRIHELARTVSGDATTATAKATRLAAHLREHYRYSTAAPSGGKQDPLAHFLFESRAGHCEFFSTALALLLRAEGVHARNVTGFAGAQRNEFGRYYSVRQQNAHAWVEYWQPLGERVGRWESIDATPVSTTPPPRTSRQRLQELYEALAARWDRHVAAFDLKDQADLAVKLTRPIDRANRLLRGLGDVRLLGAALAAAALTTAIAWRLRRDRPQTSEREGPSSPRRTDAASLARSIEATLAAHGSRASHETVREYVVRVCPPHASDAAAALVALYEGARWGDEAVDPPAVRSATEALRDALAAASATRR
jgi:transglutaminase-like putative cysteine protease